MKKLRIVLVLVISLFINLSVYAAYPTNHYEITDNVSIPDDECYKDYTQTGEGGIFFITKQGILNLGSNIYFYSNIATQNGGAIYNKGNLNVANNGYYYSNLAQVGGALLNLDTGVMNIGYDNYFEYNRATTGEGGAIENCGTLTVSSGTNFVLNQATRGGAISNSMYINSSFSPTAETGNNILFSSNTAQDGGAFYNCSATANIGDNNIFSYNSASANGGAIYNSKNDNKDKVGTITIGSNVVFSSNSASEVGGAISNFYGNVSIGDNAKFELNQATNYNGGAIANFLGGSSVSVGNNATFSSNTATQNGGAIYNETGTVNIGKNSKFEFNKTGTTDNGANGGAIANFGTMIIDENAKFTSNYTGTDGSGGAIHNCKNHDGTIGNLTIKDGASFTKNTATSGGGAISNYNSGIINILNNVSFTSNTANRFGGAILNFTDGNISAGTINIGNNVLFSNNKAQTDCGGAITNVGTITIGDNATFEQNSSVGDGGAIYNSKRGNITIGKNVTFSNNTEQLNGGAIHNEGILTLIDGGTFINNSANGTGGAIYLYNDNITEIPNSRTVNLIAKTNNIEFTGNTANGVSNAIHSNGGTINLWASNSASIVFNDAITSYDGAGKTNVLNINKSSGDLPITGKIILNEDMSLYRGTVNLYNGEIELQSKTNGNSNINTNKLFSGNINLNKGTLNILNNAIDNISLNNLTTTSNTNLKFDTDLSNNTSDNFTITNNVTGQLNLTAINILGVNGTNGQITLFNNGNAPQLNILTTATYGGYEYNFTNSNTMAGVLNYTRGEQINLKKAVNKTTPATRSYSLSGNEAVTENLGYLGGTQLTIFGNGHDIVANNNVYGIGVEEGQILNIEGVGNITDFYNSSNWGGAIMNHGTTNIGNDIKFSSNSCFYGGGAIYNGRNMNIGSNSKFEHNKTNVYGGGAIFNEGHLDIGTNVIFSSNTTTDGGGAIDNENGGITTVGTNALFEYNKSDVIGGAVRNTGDDGDFVSIGNNSSFISNDAGVAGGAIWNSKEMEIKEGTIYYSNTANQFGGAIVNCIGTLTLKGNNTFNLNSSQKGGAIANLGLKNENEKGILNIGKNVIFTSNTATNGGAIYNFGEETITLYGQQFNTDKGTININDNGSFSYNTATENGGAIYNGGNMNIGPNSKFEYNKTNVYGGGAIFNEGHLDIGTNVVFSSNTTTDGGGAIDNENGGITTVGTNALFEYNKSDVIGGAVRNTGDDGDFVSIGNNSSFISNDAGVAGGAIWNSKEMEIKEGTIYYSNTANQFGGAIVNCIGTLTLKGNNTFNLNSSQKGGAIANLGLKNENEKGILNIGKNVIFTSNTATNGGAIYNFGEETITLYGQQFNTDKGTINISDNSNFSYNTATESGGAIYNGGILSVNNGALFKNNSSSTNGGAIYNTGVLNLTAKTNNIEFTGNTANGVSNAIHDNKGKINLWASKNADIIFNDRITSKDNTSILNINNSTTALNAIGKIILNENMGGYTGQVNLYNGTIKLGEKGTLFGGNIFVDNATIDMANEIIQQHNFNTLTVNNTLKLVVDADLVNGEMDTISATGFGNSSGKINVSKINILTDIDEDETTKILFTESNILKNKITSVKTASSKLYKYNVDYNDGYFNFTNGGENPPEVNPIIAESAIASSVGGVLTQVNVLGQAFTSIDTQVSARKEAKKKSVFYASTANQIFETENKIESGLWIRPFMAQETIKFSDIDVDNTLTGTLAGIDLATGENSLVSFYLGYAGSNQKYEDIKVSQTGYIVGATGMLVKDNWYAGLTANINFNKAESQSDYGTDNFDMNMYSVGAKAGYNLELNDKWTLEPNLMLMYGNINSQEYETKQGAKIDSQNTSNMIIEPQIKANLNLTNGWQPYGLLGYVANMNDKTKVIADGQEFEIDKIDGYVEYGAGVNKDFINTPWSCYLQATGRSGGRNGFAGNIGIKYKFGNTKTYAKTVNKKINEDNDKVNKLEETIEEQKEEQEKLKRELEQLKQQMEEKKQIKENETKTEDEIKVEETEQKELKENKQDNKEIKSTSEPKIETKKEETKKEPQQKQNYDYYNDYDDDFNYLF